MLALNCFFPHLVWSNLTEYFNIEHFNSPLPFECLVILAADGEYGIVGLMNQYQKEV